MFELNTKSRNKRGSEKKEKADKESDDFEYTDDYKDILFVFPNVSQSSYSTPENVNKIDIADFDTYEDPDISEIFRPASLKERLGNVTNTTETTTESSTTVGSTTPFARDVYYDEKDADYYLRNYPKNDYIATVTVPTVIVIAVLLSILFALLHLPKCCFGLFHEPSYQKYYQKNAALAAKEELQEEFLNED